MPRLDNVTPFLVMDILRKAREMPDVVHFEVGEPDLPPPPAVGEALRRATRDGLLGYTESLGLPALREKIAEHYARVYGVQVSPGRILLTVGTSGGFLIAYSILLDAGDTLLLPDPAYPCYKNFAYLLDARPMFVPIGRASAYQLTAAQVRDAGPVKAVQISSPSNPIGNVYDRQVLRELAEYCESHGIYFISDEIYHGLSYGKTTHTALEFSERAIVVNGFSKYYALPGLRLGWLILPEDLVRRAEIVMQNMYISAPTLSQYGALAAFDYPYLAGLRETYRQRRDYLYAELGKLFDLDAEPDGAFYIWADAGRYTQDSLGFSARLLEEARVAVTPGVDFGQDRTGHSLRFAYTRDLDHLREGVARLQKFLRRIGRDRV